MAVSATRRPRPSGDSTALTVGELARRTGLSVRTLHHYHAIGLLRPARRTEAGYRLYTIRDVMRLQQIVLLRGVGLSLADIRKSLARGGPTLLDTIELHARRLRERIAEQRRLCDRLEATAARLRSPHPLTIDEIVETIERTAMTDKYFTDEQREFLAKRRIEVTEARIREVEAEWPRLIAEVRAEMDKGTPPDDPHVQELAGRWAALVEEFTGGNLGVARSVATMYREEPAMRQKTGLDAAIMEYVSRAAAFKGLR